MIASKVDVGMPPVQLAAFFQAVLVVPFQEVDCPSAEIAERTRRSNMLAKVRKLSVNFEKSYLPDIMMLLER